MKQLFRNRTNKFGSLLSITALIVMVVVFSFMLPAFLSSTAGRIFAGVWALTAIAVFIAHANTMKAPRQSYHSMYQFTGTKKDVRIQREMRTRMMRG